ncbi:MAG: [FeFe]-hydrogenase, partial [Streblomastix strix]
MSAGGMQIAVKNQSTIHYRELLRRVAKCTLDGKLIQRVDSIPSEIYKDGDKAQYFDTIEHERAVARKQLQSIMGQIIHSSRPMTKPLSECAKEALARPNRSYTPQVTVINEACHRCPVLKYYVTDACEGCFARPCETNCPRQAISRVNGKAHIDQSLCIACGLCSKNCPYGAIMKRRVPCMDNCPVDAISKDSKGHSIIDPSKCINCGRCTVRCAFEAIVM